MGGSRLVGFRGMWSRGLRCRCRSVVVDGFHVDSHYPLDAEALLFDFILPSICLGLVEDGMMYIIRRSIYMHTTASVGSYKMLDGSFKADQMAVKLRSSSLHILYMKRLALLCRLYGQVHVRPCHK